ncbi:MAG: hypothetical protein ABJG33_17095 [Balneola sp.]
MAIREKIILDTRDYLTKMNEAERAATKHANKQERLYKNAQTQMKSLSSDIRNLKRARDLANDPRVVQRYERAIESLTREYNQLENETREYSRSLQSVDRNADKSFKNVEKSGSRLKAGMLISFAAITAAASKMFSVIRSGLERGREIEEISSKYESVLGGSIQQANVFIEENARLMGLSTIQAKEYYANIVNIAQGMGFAKDQAVPFSEEILKLAGDLQSFNDVPIEQTQRAIVSALTGEREALKTLGIVVNEEMVKQQAMTQFRLEDANAITQQQKAQATLTLITEKAGKAIGDLERTQNSSSNRYRQNLAKMNDMLDSLSTKLNEGFGNDLIMWMTKGLDLAEDLVDEINKLTSSGTENLIRDLRSNNADPELIAKLEEAQAVADAQRLKMSIEKELKDIKVPVVINEMEAKDRAGKVIDGLTTVARNRWKALSEFDFLEVLTGSKSLPQTMTKLRQSLSEFKIEDESFNPEKLDEYKKRLDDMVSSLKTLSELSIGARENGFDVEADLFTSEANAYGEAVSRLAEVIRKLERINQINDQLSGKGGVELKAAVKVTEESITKFVTDIESVKLEPLILSVKPDHENQSRINDFKTVLSTSFGELINEYSEGITSLNAKLLSGEITEPEFLKRSKEYTDAYRKAIIELYEEAKKLGKLTPELEKKFTDAFGSLDNDTKEVSNNLDDIADAVSGIINVADAFGKLDDNLSNVLRGGVDVLRNLQNIKDLEGSGAFGLGGTGIAGVLPVIGIAGGVASILSSFFKGSVSPIIESEVLSGEELKELEKSISENINAVRENTQALLRNTIVGGDVTQDEVNRGAGIINNLRHYEDFTGYFNKDDILGLLQRGEFLLPDIFEGLDEIYQGYLDQGLSAKEALKKLLSTTNLFSVFDEFKQNYGQFGNSIESFITEFRTDLKFSTKTFDSSISDFLDNISSLGVDIPKQILDQIKDIDFNTEEGILELNSILANLYENALSFQGDLTPQEYSDLLNFLSSLTGGVEEFLTSIDRFIDKINDIGLDLSVDLDAATLGIDEFANTDTVELRELLDYLSSLSPLNDTDEIQKVIEALKDNFSIITRDLDDESKESIKELIDNLLNNGLTQENIDAANNLLGGSTSNVAVSSAITEFQSNDLIAIQEDALRQLKTLVSIAGSSGDIAPVIEPGPPQNSVNNSVNLGGININGAMTDNDISQITNEVARTLKKQQQKGF